MLCYYVMLNNANLYTLYARSKTCQIGHSNLKIEVVVVHSIDETVVNTNTLIIIVAVSEWSAVAAFVINCARSFQNLQMSANILKTRIIVLLQLLFKF